MRLLSPSAQVEQGHLRVDDLANRLGSALRSAVQGKRQALTELRTAWQRHAPDARVQLESHRLLSLWKRLQAASPVSVLNRGFTIIRDESGRPLMRAAKVRSGQKLAAEFADGTKPLTAD